MMRRVLQVTEGEPSEFAAGAVPSRGRWLLLIYHLPSDPSSARSSIWREVKRLGALPLQHGAFPLSVTAGARGAYTGLVCRVEEYGDEEYAGVIEEAGRFQAEVARERRQGKFTFTELEDEESDLERLRQVLAQVEARVAFDAPSRDGARAAVAGCAGMLEAFTQEIYERQGEADPTVDDQAERVRADGGRCISLART